MDQISQDPLEASMNFVGSAIGNGCWGNTVGTCAFSSPEALQIKSDFFYGHGMYSQTLRADIEDACGDWSRLTPACVQALEVMDEQIGNFDVYNIYDNCGTDQRRRLSERKSMMQVYQEMSSKVLNVETKQSFQVSAGYGGALNDYTCGAETAQDAWLAEPSVMEALHVLDGTVGMQYTKTATDMLPLYQELMEKYQMLM